MQVLESAGNPNWANFFSNKSSEVLNQIACSDYMVKLSFTNCENSSQNILQFFLSCGAEDFSVVRNVFL